MKQVSIRVTPRLVVGAGTVVCPMRSDGTGTVSADLLDNGDILCSACETIHAGGETERQMAQELLAGATTNK